MKRRAAKTFLFLALLAVAGLFAGCASTDPDNASVRPWNAPTDWQQGGALGGMDTQHR
jgi:hypothetical protein